MVDLGQARERIWQSIKHRGGPGAVSAMTISASGEPTPAVSASMLYKFKSEPHRTLGRDSVNALAPILTDIDAETWLAAMGIDRVCEPAETEAQA